MEQHSKAGKKQNMQEKESGKENKNTEGGGEMRQLREGLFKGRFCCQAGRDLKPTVGPRNSQVPTTARGEE